MAFQLLSKNCGLRHNCALRKRQAAVPSPFPLGGEEKYHAAFFTSATIFFAASPRSLAATIGRPELARISLPCWTFVPRSEEHTSELQSLMRISYAVFCLKKKKIIQLHNHKNHVSDLDSLPNKHPIYYPDLH